MRHTPRMLRQQARFLCRHLAGDGCDMLARLLQLLGDGGHLFLQAREFFRLVVRYQRVGEGVVVDVQGQALQPPWLVVDLLIHKMQHDWQLLVVVGSPIHRTQRVSALQLTGQLTKRALPAQSLKL